MLFLYLCNSILSMKKISVLLFSAILFSACSSSETPTEETKKDSIPETTEVIPISNEYFYQITDNKTGEVIELNQKDYLNSEYIDNSDFTVKEIARAN